jgi:hypothetical protein
LSATLAITGADGRELAAPLKIPSDRPRTAAGELTLVSDGAFRISLQSAGPDRVTAPNAFSGRIVLVQDGRPHVHIVRPAANTVAGPDAHVPVEIEAESSAGISRLELHRILNRGQDDIQTFGQAVPAPNPNSMDRLTHLDLKAMHVRPGDVLEYYATAFDTNPQAMQNADSKRFWVQVVTDADYATAMRQQRGPAQMIAQYRTQIQAVMRLAARQGAYASEWEDQVFHDRTPGQAHHPPSDSEATMAYEAQQIQGDLRELADQQPQYGIDRGLAEKMRILADAVHSARDRMAVSMHANAAQAIARSARAAADMLRAGLKRAGEPADQALNALEKTLPLYRDFARIRALAERELHVAQAAHDAERSQMTGRMEAFNASRLTSLSAEQSAIRSDLDSLRDDLSRHAETAQFAAPDAARTARSAAGRIKKERLLEQMRQISDLFDSLDAIDSAGLADQAHGELISLLQMADQGRKQAAKALETRTRRHLGTGAQNTLNQMANRPDDGNSQSGAPPPGQPGSDAPPPPPGSRPQLASGAAQGKPDQPTAAGLTSSQSGPRSVPDEFGSSHTAPAASRANSRSEQATRFGGGKPAPGVTMPAGGYPAEYRRLVQDYFTAVAGKE